VTSIFKPARYDAIVMGAGHNGLVAACYLARAGLSVLVLERNAFVGGAAVSRQLYQDFTYSNCSYVCSLLRPEIMRTLELPRFGLQIIPYEGGCTMMRDGGHLALGYDNHEALRREIARHSPRDAEAYDRFARDMLRQCRFIKPLLLRTPPDPTSFRPRDLMELLYLGQRFHRLGEARMYDTLRFWTMSCADLLDEYFESDIIKAHLAGSSIIGTALGPRSPGTAYVLLHHYMGDIDEAVGAWGFARGGMGAVSNALAESLQASGGRIRTDAAVETVLTSGGRATGVALQDGTEIQANIVISGMDVKRTFGLVAPDALPDDFLAAVRRFKIRGSSGKLNIALDGLPNFPAVPKNSTSMRGDLHITDTIEMMERAYDDWKDGKWSQAPYLDMLIPSQIDPTMAPDGKHYMSVFVQYCPYVLAEGPWNDARRARFGETVLDAIAAHSPDFRNLVLHAEIRTPWDIEREVGLTEGNIFQGELTMDQLLFNRPVPGYAQYRSPVKGLYMCGSSTHPGGGVMGAPGANAAREILRDLGKSLPQ
jgi:phytoene dehydrogenase-like protein